MASSPIVPPPRPAGVPHPAAREGPSLPALAGSDGPASLARPLGRGVSRQPPGLRRTPDHPPYAEMIQVALRALAEDGGSTVDAISRRIAAVYLDLPWAHERLLPHYLGRLVNAGDVAVAAPGRYALLSPSPAPAGDADPSANPNRNPNPNLNNCSQPAVTVHPDGPAAAAATPRSSSSSATAAVVDNGAGEGLGARTLAVAVAATASCGDEESQCDRLSLPATAAVHGGDEERPSMPDPSSATALVVWQNERPFGQDCYSGAVAGHSTCFVESKNRGKRVRGRSVRRRGRGRPPNGARYHWQPASGTYISDPGVGCIVLSECGKGRPPNSLILSSTHGEERLPMSSPPVRPMKGRGRPPKCKPTVVTSDATPAHDSVHLLNFGSSCDPKCMELDRDVHRSWSLGDGTSSAEGKVLSNSGAAPGLKVIFRLPRKPDDSPAEDSSTPDLSLMAEQVAVPVPKRPRTSIDHKPRKINTTLVEERVNNPPLVQTSEQMVCTPPANVKDSSPSNIIRSQPLIEGWVQVLLAVQPTTKVKKSRQNKRKMVHPIVQFRPDNFLLNRVVEDATQMDAWFHTSMTKQTDTDGFLQGKVDENRTEIEGCEKLIPALSLDPNGSSQTTEEENLQPVGGCDEPMSTVPFHAVEEENVAHGIQGRETLRISHSALEGSLQTGKKECRTQLGGHIESLPSERFTPANMEGFVQLLVTGLSKTRDLFQREQTSRLHPAVFVSEPPVKQLGNKELESKPQDERSILEFPVDQSRPEDHLEAEEVQREKERIGLHADVSEPLVKQLVNKELGNEQWDEESVQEFSMVQSWPEDDLQAEEVNGSDSKRCPLVLPRFGDDLQTEDMSEPPSVEFLLPCTAEQRAVGNSLQSQEAVNRPWGEGSVEKPHVQNPKPLDDLGNEQRDEESVQEFSMVQSWPEDDLQAEEVNESDSKRCPLVLPRFGDDLQTEDMSEPPSVEFLLPCTAEQRAVGDSLQSQEAVNRPWGEGSVEKPHVQNPKPLDDLQSEENESDAGKCLNVLPHEQAKLLDDLPFEKDENGEHALGCMIEFSAKEPPKIDSSWMHQLEEEHDELFNRKLAVEQTSPGDELQTDCSNRLHSEKYVEVLHEEQPKLGDKLLSGADEHVSYAEGYVPAFQEKGPIHGNSLQAQELEKRPEDEDFAQVIPMDEHPAEDDLNWKDPVESHVDGYLQMSPQEQEKPADDLQMDERSRAHADGLVLLLPLEKPMVCDFVQMSESDNNIQTEESIEDASSKLSRLEDPLQMEETYGLHNDGLLQGPGTKQSKTYPLQSNGEKNSPVKKNKKHTRKLWFEC